MFRRGRQQAGAAGHHWELWWVLVMTGCDPGSFGGCAIVSRAGGQRPRKAASWMSDGNGSGRVGDAIRWRKGL